MLKISEITTEICQQRVADVLRDYIGPGKKWGYQPGADALGVERSTLESWVLGRSMPTLPKLMKLFWLLGPIFANRIIRLGGLDGARKQQLEPITDLELNADAARYLSDMAEALRDGRIHQRDRAKYIDDVRILQQAAQEWLEQVDGVPGDPEIDPDSFARAFSTATSRGNA